MVVDSAEHDYLMLGLVWRAPCATIATVSTDAAARRYAPKQRPTSRTGPWPDAHLPRSQNSP
eukprot:3221135-Alexandrium_andersonii.AAC.1